MTLKKIWGLRVKCQIMSNKPKFYSDPSDCVRSLDHLSTYAGPIAAAAWSPDGNWLATCSADSVLCLWDTRTGRRRFQDKIVESIRDIDFSPDSGLVACSTPKGVVLFGARTLKVQLQETIVANDTMNCIRWAPKGRRLAIGCGSGKVCFADLHPSHPTLTSLQFGVGHASSVRSLAWAPDGETVVSGTDDGIIGIWKTSWVDNQLRHFLPGPAPKAHEDSVVDLAWCMSTGLLASLSDLDIMLWNVDQRRLERVYRCTERIFDVRFCAKGEFLAARLVDKLIFIEIRRLRGVTHDSLPNDGLGDDGEKPEIFTLDCSTTEIKLGFLSVDNASGRIAAEDQSERTIKVWDLDFNNLIQIVRTTNQRYRIGKVVVVGERGVGKTNLISSLMGKPFLPESSKHDLKVHRLQRSVFFDEKDGTSEVREILLWDRCNRDNSQILESIDTTDVSTILAVFDWQSSCSSERAFARLNTADRTDLTSASLDTCPNSILIAGAKADRAHESRSSEMHSILRERPQVPKIFSTSAREGTGIGELRDAICNSIDWKECGVFEPARRFQDIYDFVVALRQTGQTTGPMLEPLQSLSFQFLKLHQVKSSTALLAMFKAGINLLKTLGEVYYFSRTDLVLLDPTYLYTYTSTLVKAAQRDEAQMGRLPMVEISAGGGKQLRLTELSEGDRLPIGSQERLLLHAIVLELIDYHLAYEVSTDGVQYLVFPSQPIREFNVKLDTNDAAALATLERNGPGTYSSLVVRLLSLNPFFSKPELYHNAAVFNALSGGSCTLLFDPKQSPDASEIKIFFDQEVNEATQNAFLSIVRSQVPDLVLSNTSNVPAGEKKVFVSYEHRYLPNVLVIGEYLRERNIVPWIYDVAVKAGHQEQMSRVLALQEHSIAVFALGDGKLSDPMRRDLDVFMKRHCAIIPVILPGAQGDFEVPEDLRGFATVDFRNLASDPFKRLAEGILDARARLNKRPPPISAGNSQVFLSYYHDDEEAVGLLRSELLAANVSVWWDKDILGGEDWKTRIHIELKNSYAVIACFSPQSAPRMRSGVFDELDQTATVLRALPSNGLHLIPVMLSTCQLPIFRFGDNRYLEELQAIDLSEGNRKQKIASLLKALAAAREQRAQSKIA